MSKLLYILVISVCLLLLVVVYYKHVAEDERELKQFYCANNQVLINKVRKIYDDKLETDRTNEELRRAIAEDKDSSFDWSADISATLPIRTIKQLHKDRSKIR